ncbi:MAG: NAD(P)(+) transhydrogenase (Re/Si-specific) subunit beta [Gammaproteobacteria bacterium]|nr:NAD(P)(+) transhydrogenase (Re/Si-specific) subunit beta [Gammaproteobacteria bacterium]
MILPIELVDLGYIIASILFIYGLKMLSQPTKARLGNGVSFLGMLVAIVVTLLSQGLDFSWIIVGVVIGSLLGLVSALKVKMTAMPEMVALFNGSGGLASVLVGYISFHQGADMSTASLIAIGVTVVIGGVCFSGSLVAFGKLAEKLTDKPVLFTGQQVVNVLILLGIVVGTVLFVISPSVENQYLIIYGVIFLALVLGIMSVLAIGGADMPVVIALLNSYSGLAACGAGFVIVNKVLIVSGALVGASGLILTNIMCKGMNRSLANVLFSGFGSATPAASGGGSEQGEVRASSLQDVYYVLEAARSVVLVPGYGMAVAQAQHAVRELGDILEANGTEVKYAIHPVAGRMPGHMNVLLAEANVPYEQLFEMDDVNPTINTVDVCIVIGANDVVNPSAREDKSSPIYGMPIINVDYARTVYVLKRSMNAGFAGIQNPLFFKENTRMVFGDAKATMQGLIAEFKE